MRTMVRAAVAVLAGVLVLTEHGWARQSWTTPWTATTGVTVTAAQLNETRDNLTVLRAGGLAISGQAANRIPYATSSTQLATSAALTFDGSVFTASGAGVHTFGTSGGDGRLYAQGTSETQFSVRNAAGAGYFFGATSGATPTAVWKNTGGTTRMELSDAGGLTVSATIDTGRYDSGAAQPGFLAYNSAGTDACGTVCTVEADTEAYDTTEAFDNSTDTFTAAVDGAYLFCAGVRVNDTLASPPNQTSASIVTTAGTYQIDYAELGSGESAGLSGCVIVELSSTDTAFVRVNSGGVTVTGNSSSRMTFFSGRLMP